jgi:RNA polymerase sigma factor (sigma-70 family)
MAHDEIIKLIRSYRQGGLDERLLDAAEIYTKIEWDLRMYILGKVSPNDADDVLMITLTAIFKSLHTFEGETDKAFWKWCYRIARFKISDHYRDKSVSKTEPFPPDDIINMMNRSDDIAPVTKADYLDLEYAMKLLTKSKPECYDLLWNRFIRDLDYSEIAEQENKETDAVRMKIGRCLDTARKLVEDETD